jgi:hypothetical protein
MEEAFPLTPSAHLGSSSVQSTQNAKEI